MKNLNDIQQSQTSNREFDLATLPKSGFNLSESSVVDGLVLGRYHPTFMRPCMPGDKFSASNDAELYANQLVTERMPDVKVSIHNFFVTFRSIDKSFEKRMSPTRVNNMSANDNFPRFDVKAVVTAMYHQMLDGLFANVELTSAGVRPATWPVYSTKIAWDLAWASRMASLSGALRNSFCDDLLFDLRDQLYRFVSVTPTTAEDAGSMLLSCLYAITDFWFGEGSVADYMQLPIVKHSSVDVLYDAALAAVTETEDVFVSLWYQVLDDMFASYYQCEYIFRALYAIWFEHGRSKDLEPITATLPDYRDFGASPIIGGGSFASYAYLLLVRCRLWSADGTTTAMIDDISRHIFAPVLQNSAPGQVSLSSNFAQPVTPVDSNNTIMVGSAVAGVPGAALSKLTIPYVDQYGVKQTVDVLVPQSVSTSHPDFNRLGLASTSGSQVLDIFELRKARMTERFLKRNSLGDEYRDKMLNQYGARIEDYRINRPEYLSGSVTDFGRSQNIASASGPGSDDRLSSQPGQRTAMGQAEVVSQDGCTMFCPEFGFFISFLSLLPVPQYDPAHPVHNIEKFVDLPIPVFADQQEDLMNTSEIARSLFKNANQNFGHVPYANAWRMSLNTVHGHALSTRANLTFGRFFSTNESDGLPKLNYQYLHCRPTRLDMFQDKILLDGQFFGVLKHNFIVERSLPTPIETI